jgi:hypothetical protein
VTSEIETRIAFRRYVRYKFVSETMTIANAEESNEMNQDMTHSREW